MKEDLVKAIAAVACAALVGMLGVTSWHSEQEAGSGSSSISGCSGAVACDEVIFEIEKLHSTWGNYDPRTGYGAREAGNP
jgi:hypothetical protein